MTLEPCGNLPVYGLNLSVYHCHLHGSTWWNGYVYTQEGEDIYKFEPSVYDQCGQFINDQLLVEQALKTLWKRLDGLILPFGRLDRPEVADPHV